MLYRLKEFFKSLFVLITLLFQIAGNAAEVIRVACRPKGDEVKFLKEKVAVWEQSNPGYKIEFVMLPNNTTECLTLLKQILANSMNDAQIDVLCCDGGWALILKEYLQNLVDEVSEEDVSEFLEVAINQYKDKTGLYALPYYADVTVLYVRKDLLDKYNRKIPESWEELFETAKIIQDGERDAGNKKMYGFVFQGKAYEGLTCFFIEYMAAYNAKIINNKQVVLDTPNVLQALVLLASSIGSISPTGVLNYSDEEVRGAFQSGNAVFMRNWPYAMALFKGSSIDGKVVLAPLPKGNVDGGKNAAILGGWGWAIAKKTKFKAAAKSLLLYLTGDDVQREHAVKYGFMPSKINLYNDVGVMTAHSEMKELYNILQDAVNRPTPIFGSSYQQASGEISQTLNAMLANTDQIKEKIIELEKKLNDIIKNNKTT